MIDPSPEDDILQSCLTIDGPLMRLAFPRYSLDLYPLFLKAKALPERTVAYAWETDVYTIEAPARFAAQLGYQAMRETVDDLSLAAHLFDYQQFIILAALEAQRYAIWATTGSGKTAMFLEWARHVMHRTNGKVLIFSPLNIIAQTEDESRKFYGDRLPLMRLTSREELQAWCRAPGSALGITNYEKLNDGLLNECRLLAGMILDEGSRLKASGGVQKWNLIKSARGIEYKLSCTATPAPNDVMEFASQASFLEKLRSEGEVLWTYYSRDKRGNWHIKSHAKGAFYRFLASWSIYLRNPACFGWHDIWRDVPAPVIHEHRLPFTPEQWEEANKIFVSEGTGMYGQEHMGVKQRLKLSQLAKGFLYGGSSTKRAIRHVPSLKPAMVVRLIREALAADRQTLVWTVFDEESAILVELLKSQGITVDALHGTMADEDRAPVIERFRRGESPVLISKASLLGYGMNFQRCQAMIFSGLDDSFERTYQAIRRAYRFGQTHAVHVHYPFIPELEGMIFENIQRKAALFEQEATLHEHAYLEVIHGKQGLVD